MLDCVAIADTHGMYRDIAIPYGDILIHAGDITMRGKLEELEDFNNWLGELPHRYKIVIAGNHDWCFERRNAESRKIITNGIYLEDDSIDIDGYKFYGSPWQPWFFNWAFNLNRGKDIKAKWDLIPTNVDVLITHGPVYGVLDKVISGEHVGCEDLLRKVKQIKPSVHVCGHIHEGYGVIEQEDTTFLNASVNSERYKPINSPIKFTLE
ncbi:MAG: metallophosphoesterase [Alteromonadaceae bacterium]|nr:metallophosphoesterase [Alteromonadaceae bacterium]